MSGPKRSETLQRFGHAGGHLRDALIRSINICLLNLSLALHCARTEQQLVRVHKLLAESQLR